MSDLPPYPIVLHASFPKRSRRQLIFLLVKQRSLQQYLCALANTVRETGQQWKTTGMQSCLTLLKRSQTNDYQFPGCDAVQSGGSIPTFRLNIVSMFYPEDGGGTFFRYVGKDLPPHAHKLLASKQFNPAESDFKYNFIYIYDLRNGDITSSYSVGRQNDCSHFGIHRLILTFRRSILHLQL